MPEWMYVILGIALVAGFLMYIANDDARGEIPENNQQSKTSKRR